MRIATMMRKAGLSRLLLASLFLISLSGRADTSHAMSAPAPSTNLNSPTTTITPCRIFAHRAGKTTDGACLAGNLAVAEKACLDWLNANAKGVLAGWNSAHGFFLTLEDGYREASTLYAQAEASAGQENWADVGRDYSQAAKAAFDLGIVPSNCENAYWSVMSRLNVYLTEEDLYLGVSGACRSADVNYISLKPYQGMAHNLRAGCKAYASLAETLAARAETQAADAFARARQNRDDPCQLRTFVEEL